MPNDEELKREPEHRGSIWSHPHTLYLLFTTLLFLLLCVLGYIGYKSGIIPNRGIG